MPHECFATPCLRRHLIAHQNEKHPRLAFKVGQCRSRVPTRICIWPLHRTLQGLRSSNARSPALSPSDRHNGRVGRGSFPLSRDSQDIAACRSHPRQTTVDRGAAASEARHEEQNGASYYRLAENSIASQQSRAEQFCANADECDREAEPSSDLQPRAEFTDLARQWRLLADEVEHKAGGLDSV
jgi:hypothetical protein